MTLLDGGLAALFGAAFAPLYRDATLTKLAPSDDGAGGFSTAPTTTPARALVEAVSDAARAASGIPDEAVTLSVLRAGLGAALDLDDEVTVGGVTFRVIRVGTDPAGAAYTCDRQEPVAVDGIRRDRPGRAGRSRESGGLGGVILDWRFAGRQDPVAACGEMISR